MNNSQFGTRWKTRSLYIDIDTGQSLTKNESKQDYTIIKKTTFDVYNTTNLS